MSFQINPLPETKFQHLFQLSFEELASQRAVRMISTRERGFPCRVSLMDANIGEEVILVHYEHQPADSPYRASHAVFVRKHAKQAKLSADQVPEVLRSRMLSLRAFDHQGMMTAADLADGTGVEAVIEKMFLDSEVAYIHIHFAMPGCYAARADRA